MPRPIAAGVFGMARTTAASRGKMPARNAIVRPAMIETTTVEGDIREATCGMISGAICGLTAMTIASGQIDAGWINTEADPALQQRTAHFAGSDEHHLTDIRR